LSFLLKYRSDNCLGEWTNCKSRCLSGCIKLNQSFCGKIGILPFGRIPDGLDDEAPIYVQT
jgi:hypothetical protein